MNLIQTTIALFLITLFFSTACGDDWPQWRGKNRDGVWTESGVVEELPDQANIKWQVDLGSGYSGPTVANGRVFVMDLVKETETMERVLCFDSQSGKEIWTYSYPCEYRIGYTAGPRASVTVDSDYAYSLGAMGQLICFQAKSGEVIWQKDLNKEYSIESKNGSDNRMPIWGMTCSPIVYGEKLILQIGARNAGVVAFDKKTGGEIWKATDDRGQYSSPVITKQGDQDVLICWTGDAVHGIAPDSGQVFWSIEWKPRNMPIGCATPIIKDQYVFCTSFYDGSMLIKLDGDQPKAQKVYHRVGANEKQTDALQSIISTPIWIEDHIYGVDSYGQLRCLDARTGDRVWEDLTAVPKARWSTIHFVKNGDRVWMFNERGELMIAKLSPDVSPKGFELISRLKIISPTKNQLNRRGGVCWTHPAFAEKSIFVRNDRSLICVDLAE